MPRTSTRIRYSAEERQAKLDAAHERLQEAVETLVSSEDWLGYLKVMSRFHSYSPTNALLIATQRPDATLVAGYRKWPEFGRHVKKGAKGIVIFAPVTAKFIAEADDAPSAGPDGPREPGAVRRLVGFRLATVFDVSDTEGEDLPESPARATLLEGEAPEGMVEALVAQVEAAGCTVAYAPEIAESPGANGITDYTQRRVTVATSGRSAAAQAKTLAHELAHVLLHHPEARGNKSRPRCEVEAESVAYLVCDAWGLDSVPYTLGYVATWANGDAEAVLATAKTVRQTATVILTGAPVLAP